MFELQKLNFVLLKTLTFKKSYTQIVLNSFIGKQVIYCFILCGLLPSYFQNHLTDSICLKAKYMSKGEKNSIKK